VVVVSCPCALSLATPVALTAANGALVRIGLLATREHVLEGLGEITHVVFDKTGTLTEGHVRLVRAVPTGARAVDECLAVARLLEGRSSHPIAAAFTRGPVPARPVRARIDDVRAVAGKGMEAVIDGVPHRLGAPEWAAELAPGAVPPPPADGGTWVLLAAAGGLRCWFELDDAVRPEAADAVAALATLGLEVAIVSGDAASAVERLARRLGVAVFASRATPESKLAHVRALQARGAVVLMVGDGVNDAPGLGGAQVAIAMGGGTDLARTRADAVLLRENLLALPSAVRLARRTRRVIRENLAWALAYNAVAVPLAAFGLVPPYWAALGMSASSLVVTANAWKLGLGRLRERVAEPTTLGRVGSEAAA
jgi:P-type Cu2+ transporter